jgi:hypothetical protein
VGDLPTFQWKRDDVELVTRRPEWNPYQALRE